MNFLAIFIDQIYETPFLEWVAVIFGIFYVILVAKKIQLCWFFAFFSSVIYVYLCFNSKLYLESFLQLFYALMAIYGWYQWRKDALSSQTINETTPASKSASLLIIEWTWAKHLSNILISFFTALVVGFIFDKYTAQVSPYLDAMITVFSLTSTYLVTQRVLSNWIYWVFIDTCCIFLYYSRGYALSSLLYITFTSMALYGYLVWQKEYRKQFSNA